MRLLNEKSPGDMSPSELIRQHGIESRRASREEYKREKLKRWKQELKLRTKSEKRKREHLDQQMKQAAINAELRKQKEAAAAAKSTGGGEVISSKDTDPTATRKAISNVASVAGALFKVGGKALAGRMREKEAAREAGQKKAGEKAAETKAAMKQKLLPPGRSSEFEKTDKTSQRQPGTSRSKPTSPQPVVTTGQSARLFNQGNRPRLPSSIKRPSGGPIIKRTEPHSSSYAGMSKGQRARLDPNFRQKLIQNRMEEYEYSCWREEFLYELGELRQKAKSKVTNEEPIIDIMKGKNKITIGPNISESTETSQDKFDRRVVAAKLLKGQAKIKMLKYAASKYPKVNEELTTAAYMAKATPAITGRTKVMSDIHLSKQPGKGTAEMVRDRMRKMFMNEPVNKRPFDFAKESYDEDDETFRQHSRERFTSGSGDEARKKRTSAVLKAMAALNKDVEPKAKKKKKKKSDQ